MIDRLKQFMDLIHITSSQLADRAGIPRPTLSQILNRPNDTSKNISSDVVNKLHQAFPELNVMWLLFDEGAPMLDENIEVSAAYNGHLFDNLNGYNNDKDLNTSQRFQKNNLLDFEAEKFESRVFSEKEQYPTQNSASTNFVHQTLMDSNSTENPTTPNRINLAPPNENTVHREKERNATHQKSITRIIVLYDDQSFESFIPNV